MKTLTALRYLQDLWDEKTAATLDEPELLRYRSNLLGADLRITNFGGGNTSSKVLQPDPLTGQTADVLWVKGSGGDLGSIKRAGLATLYLDKLLAIEKQYKGVAQEDAVVELYPLCTFGVNPTVASIDTPLHGFLPFRHVDHLHPDWGIAMAAAANGKEKMEEFNREYEHKLVWVPWQRPGFELGLMMRRAVQENPGCDGIVLGGHGLFTWGEAQRECYLNTLTMIDHLGQFVQDHIERKGAAIFGGAALQSRPDRREIAIELLPFVRGRVSQQRRFIGSWSDGDDVMRFVNSNDGAALAHLGTSCPDHFIRTKIRPMFVPAAEHDDAHALQKKIEAALETYRAEYGEYYKKHQEPTSPAMRDPNPTVVLIPGVGMFSFGKSKSESRVVGEFYTNAIHVMEGATGLAGKSAMKDIPQAGAAAPCEAFEVYSNYVALPAVEAFRIEYWLLEEAKLRRQPPEKELSRRIALIVGGASGIGRAAALIAAERGAHLMIADRDLAGAEAVAQEARTSRGQGRRSRRQRSIFAIAPPSPLLCARPPRASVGSTSLSTPLQFFPHRRRAPSAMRCGRPTLDLNVTANYLLAEEAARIFSSQKIDGSIVLTSSANAVVPKRGSEAYDVSKAALSHLVRELAVSLAPHVRVNGISPATVVKGSTMFPRDRVMTSLTKYNIPFEHSMTDDQLRDLLAGFYAQRTLTNQPIEPDDCARAILFLAGPHTRCTTGHLIPVDGGLPEAFLR